MAMVLREVTTVKRGRGRPVSERIQIQDQGWRVVGETGEVLEHLQTATEIDRHCDTHTAELHQMLHRLETAVQVGDLQTVAGIVQAAGNVIHEIQTLDALEEAQWLKEMPLHITDARDAGREVIRLTDEPMDMA